MSGRGSEDDTPTPMSNVPLGYSPDGHGQMQQYSPSPVSGTTSGAGAGAGYGLVSPEGCGQTPTGYGAPFVTMSEMEQRRAKDAGGGGGWGPRELDGGGFQGGGYAHAHEQPDKNGVYEVVTEEKAVEMPTGIERYELSSGWEDQNGPTETDTSGGRRT